MSKCNHLALVMPSYCMLNSFTSTACCWIIMLWCMISSITFKRRNHCCMHSKRMLENWLSALCMYNPKCEYCLYMFHWSRNGINVCVTEIESSNSARGKGFKPCILMMYGEFLCQEKKKKKRRTSGTELWNSSVKRADENIWGICCLPLINSELWGTWGTSFRCSATQITYVMIRNFLGQAIHYWINNTKLGLPGRRPEGQHALVISCVYRGLQAI